MEPVMSGFSRLGLVVIAASALAVTLSATPEPRAIWSLPTIAPTNSPWYDALLDMGAAVARDTTGRVKINVFPGGKLGGEPSVVRAMRSGQFEISLLMLTGLAQIDDGFNALGVPFFFKDDAEAKAVQEALAPQLERRISAQKFHLLAWTNGGWVQLFSTKPLTTLDQIKKANLWTSDGDVKMLQWYKANGFHPVALDAKDVASALRIGTIDATPSPAYAASLLSMNTLAPNMLDIHIGPLFGALVVTTTAWNTVSPEDQGKITAAAKIFEKTTSLAIPAKEAGAVTEMQKRGLTVNKMAAKDAADLYAQIDKLVQSMRGEMVPAEMYDAAKAARDAYRSKAKAPGPR
jgi:TRAP-type C4-dicarboxylate transport system substrate-binding protein